MPAGRPLKYETPEALQKAVDAYFDNLKEGQPPTVSGLALALDVDTSTLRNYEGREEFFATIKKAKQRIEEALESGLWGGSVTGLIFNLKNNFGWKDKQEVDHQSSDGSMTPQWNLQPVKANAEGDTSPDS